MFCKFHDPNFRIFAQIDEASLPAFILLSNQVLDECNRQITDATGKQQGKIDELNSEIRCDSLKLWTMGQFGVDYTQVFFQVHFQHIRTEWDRDLNLFLFRKLKAMIVKHETRIRTLETKNKEQEKQLMSQVRTLFQVKCDPLTKKTCIWNVLLSYLFRASIWTTMGTRERTLTLTKCDQLVTQMVTSRDYFQGYQTLGFFVTLTIFVLVMPRRSCAEAAFMDINGLAAIIVTQQEIV